MSGCKGAKKKMSRPESSDASTRLSTRQCSTGRCDLRLTRSPPALNGRLLRLPRLQRARSNDDLARWMDKESPDRPKRSDGKFPRELGSLDDRRELCFLMIAWLAGNSAKPSQRPGGPRSPLRGRRGRRRRVHVDAIRLLVLDDNYRGGRFCPIRTGGLSFWRVRRTPLSAGKRNSELPITVTADDRKISRPRRQLPSDNSLPRGDRNRMASGHGKFRCDRRSLELEIKFVPLKLRRYRRGLVLNRARRQFSSSISDLISRLIIVS